MSERHRSALLAVAIVSPLVAIAPIVLNLDSAWIALHLIGGASALAILIFCCWKLEGQLRWLALAGVAISIATISVITGGGTIGPLVQIVMLAVLGSIYVAVVRKVTRHE